MKYHSLHVIQQPLSPDVATTSTRRRQNGTSPPVALKSGRVTSHRSRTARVQVTAAFGCSAGSHLMTITPTPRRRPTRRMDGRRRLCRCLHGPFVGVPTSLTPSVNDPFNETTTSKPFRTTAAANRRATNHGRLESIEC